jgi:site-specific recombinase XerD
MMPARERLTEKLVRGLEPRHDDYQVFDEEVRGLAVAVYASGSRAFNLSYRFHGRQRRITIGRWPEWSVVSARERAKFLRREIDAGTDPLGRREEARAVPHVVDLIDRYTKEHVPRLAPRNGSDQVSMLRSLVKPEWKNRLVPEITPADVERLLTKVAEGRARPAMYMVKSRGKRQLKGARPTPVRANRCGEVLRKMFNLAIKWKMRQDNPADGFRRREEVERDVFLSIEEIGRLAEALNAADNQRGAAIVRLCMLTGARLGEVRQARFDQFNLELAVWIKQAATTKQRRVHRVPISAEAAALIRQRRAAVPAGCPWLFPGDAEPDAAFPEGKPVQEIRRFWQSLQTKAQLPGVRLHDLRHTFASLLVSGGASLPMIGKLLGHTQAKTTQRYAHLAELPLRAGVNAVAEILTPRPRLVHNADGE